jgi:hypothetical protein
MSLQTETVSAAIAAIETGALTITGVKTFSDTPKMDAIAEATSTAGVTIDGCLIKDGSAALSGTTSNPLGAWVDKTSSYGAQQASTDGIVVVTATADSSGAEVVVLGYTDGNANPTTLLCGGHDRHPGGSYVGRTGFTMPVKKSNYWKVVLSTGTMTSVRWIPIGV